jgi:CheY-like chemotaxis protein
MNAVLQPRQPSSPTAPPCRRVLLVEDNAFIIELLRLVLARHGEVLLATDAAQGWALAQREHPDVVITDLCFGGSMSGHDLLRALRADARLTNTPVLVISAHASQADIEASLALGAQAHMGKPFSPLHLLRWLEAL